MFMVDSFLYQGDKLSIHLSVMHDKDMAKSFDAVVLWYLCDAVRSHAAYKERSPPTHRGTQQQLQLS